jgi:nuclear pore complex protein Nup54
LGNTIVARCSSFADCLLCGKKTRFYFVAQADTCVKSFRSTGGTFGGFDGMGGNKDDPITKAIEDVVTAYKPGRANRFQFVFYNIVHPDVAKHSKKTPLWSRQQYQQAVANNPDPSRLVPVPARGFDDLKLRLAEQDKARTVNTARLANLREELAKIQQKHIQTVEQEIPAVIEKHRQLSSRLIKIMGKLETQKAHRYPLTRSEAMFKKGLDNLKRELNRPSNFASKVQELDSIVRTQNLSGDDSNFIDPVNLKHISRFLQDQNRGIKHLLAKIKKDLRDIKIIQKGLSSHNAKQSSNKQLMNNRNQQMNFDMY